MIIVTGGGGFVGSHIVERLAHRGEEVLAVDLHEPAQPVKSLWEPYRQRIRFEQVDITDKKSLIGLFTGNHAKGVVHAAMITPTADREKEEPERILHIGVVGSSLVINTAARHGVKRFIYLSSASIYEPITDPHCVLGEMDRLQQTGLYPLTKVAGEWMTRYLSECSGMEAASVRIAACYGPLERNTGARTLMSQVWKAVHRARNRKPLLVGSPDYRLDFSYVKDIAEGIVELLLAPNMEHDVYNISGGSGYSLLELAEAVAGMIPGTEIRVTEEQSDDVLFAKKGSRAGRLDIARLTDGTSFVPIYNLNSGLADYLKWLEKHEF
ncbi:UDP-glucose 4-epimerase [Paenibacillus sp. 1_12]|uniref:NAD-dependent epimerase/dehydratase family protein n=1 Tax=Paenibacillus sp. 1_12 TaxID=1566278 RepID=UPI0008EAB1AB|nr:NAD(P)-dependent oxidoreductase [Paenibacillus sp. 1_12]SFK68087.1 UDP-glucose 4-epimerase [Paenibacillus sp. 1_12]